MLIQTGENNDFFSKVELKGNIVSNCLGTNSVDKALGKAIDE
jgi:hypothetical protein